MSTSVTGPKSNAIPSSSLQGTQRTEQVSAPKLQGNTANSSQVGHNKQDTFTSSTANFSWLNGGTSSALNGTKGVTLQQQGGGTIVHTVQEGDTLSSIASQYGVSLQAIKDANPQLSAPYMIFPGDKINVPVAGGTGGTGGSTGAGGSSGTGSASGTGGTSGTPEAATGTVSGQSVVDAAHTFLETNTNSFMGQCLNFVTTVLAQAGISDPLLAQPSAADAMNAVQDAGKLNAWPNPPTNVPVGAVVFWADPKPDGHAAIYGGMKDGKPVYITSPVGPMTAPGERTITSLTDGTPTPPAGYYIPQGMEQPVTVG